MFTILHHGRFYLQRRTMQERGILTALNLVVKARERDARTSSASFPAPVHTAASHDRLCY